MALLSARKWFLCHLSCRFSFGGGWTISSGEAERQVAAAMSSGEGSEETAKDAGDIEAFFKNGETGNECTGSVGSGPTKSWSSCMRGHCSAPLLTDFFLGGDTGCERETLLEPFHFPYYLFWSACDTALKWKDSVSCCVWLIIVFYESATCKKKRHPDSPGNVSRIANWRGFHGRTRLLEMSQQAIKHTTDPH